MNQAHYNIVFRGDIVFGFQLADVKMRLQQLFKTDENKINALFTGKPVVLKRNLGSADAEKYKQALLAAGARVDMVVAEAANIDPVASQYVEPKASVSAPIQAQVPVQKSGSEQEHKQEQGQEQKQGEPNQSAVDWSLAPVGADLMAPAERGASLAPSIHISEFGVRPLGADLLDPAEQQPIPARVTAPDFGLAEVGADLLTSEERPVIAAVQVDVSQYDLAELGADLIAEDEKDIVASGVVNIPDVGLAPVGADLGQIKSNAKPLTPDISGIHLVD